MIDFQTTPFTLNNWTILLLPKDASAQLPSRGQVMVKGTMDGEDFTAVLEPDGRGSHWFRLEGGMPKAKPGDTVELSIEPTKNWTEPDIPADIKKGIAADKDAQRTWDSVTPMARREWIRWIRATNNPETRQKHIEVARSKLSKGMRRPCCFNARMCTEPAVSKAGVLLEPAQVNA
jgi:hypothetical protein